MGKVQENKRKLYIQTSTTIREEWKSNNPTERDSGNIRRPLQKNLTKHTKETRKKKEESKGKTDHHPYNEAFKEEELKIAMKQQKDTSPGEDSIHPRMVKMLPPVTKRYILDLYSRIWMEGEIPNSWKSAIITPFLKEGKTQKT